MSIGTTDHGQRPPRRALTALCLTQVTSWGVLYYAFPVALTSITVDTGWSGAGVTAAFSTGLIVSAATGIPVGRLLDRYGPRPVMTGGSLLAVPALVLVALAPNMAVFVAGWTLAGVAMAAVFYQAAFAALTRWYGPRRVRALTTLTLAGGLASTLFAPATELLLRHHSWRVTYLILALVLAAVTIPAHALLLSPKWTPTRSRRPPHRVDPRIRHILRSSSFLLLCGRLTVTAFALHAAGLALIPLLTDRGLSPSLAAITLGLLGAGQLLGRLGYGPLSTRTTPDTRTGIVLAAAAGGLLTLAVVPGPPAALIAAAVLVGATRGAATLLQATLVADHWGTTRYATLAGLFAAPITIAAALAPWAAAALAGGLGGYPATFGVLAILVGFAAAAGRIRTGDRPGVSTENQAEPATR